MLSDGQRLQLEAEAANEMRKHWGDIKPNALAAAIDDMRARLIDEGWFSRTQPDATMGLRESVRFAELYGQDAFKSEVSRDNALEQEAEASQARGAEL